MKRKSILLGSVFGAILLLMAAVFSAGFHYPSEIVPGQFQVGDYSFNGNVGIGTSNPQKNIHIIDSGYPTIRIESTNIQGGLLSLKDSVAETEIFTTEGDLRVNVDGTNRMIINHTNGNVGIGTLNPTGLLHIANTGGTAKAIIQGYIGNITLTQDSSNLQASVTINGYEHASYTGGHKLVMGSNDLVIGTKNAVQGTGNYVNDIQLSTENNFEILTAGTSRIYFTNSGNVGIGTRSPSAPLTLSGPNYPWRGQLMIRDTTTGPNADAYMSFWSGDENGVDNTGLLGYVGFVSDSDNSLSIGTYPNSGHLLLNQWGGNVGIGTTAPTQNLDVRGNIVATSVSSQGTYLGLFKDLGSLPGYPTSRYATVKTDDAYLYFSAGGVYSAHMSSGGVWTTISSKSKKENFEDLDYQEILTKIDTLPMKKWNYISEDDSVKHIGPFAEDFHQAFNLNGDDNTMISTIDPSGVALVGIKALSEKIKEQQVQIDALKQLVCEDHPSSEVCQ